MTSRPRSARIERLRRRLSAEPAEREHLLRRFWARVDAEGTPLVEPGPHPGERIVTFLWREGVDDRDLTGPTTPVMVIGGPALWWQLSENVLEPLPGTDIRFRSYRADAALRGQYRLAPGDPLTEIPRAGTVAAVTRAAHFTADHRNRAPLVLRSDDPLRPSVTWSTFALPDATPPVDRVVDRPGRLTCARVTSGRLGNTRRVWTYRSHPEWGDPRHLLVMLDGRDWIEWMPLPAVLDALIADGVLPPLAVLLPESLDTATRFAELPATAAFSAFLTGELLEWARPRIAVPSDPAHVAVHGVSYGGVAALSAALDRPDLIGTVIAQSGSFWWTGQAPADPPVEVLPDRIARVPRAPGLRVSLDIGTLEGDAMLGAHDRTVGALAARGYPLRTHRFAGGHDITCWLHELPAALRWWTAG